MRGDHPARQNGLVRGMSDDIIKGRAARDQQVFDDLQNESAGRDTGRIQRFGLAAARDFETKREAKRDQAYRDALHRLLMTDPEYRRLYEDLGNALRDAETSADSEIASLESELARTQAELKDMRDAAPKIDGMAVFRTEDGRVIDEEGNEVSNLMADDIVWPPNAVSAEDYLAVMTDAAHLQASLDAWQGYRNDTLGDLRDRHEDRDNPMDKDAMRGALQEIERAQPDAIAQASNPDLPDQPEIALNQSAFPTFGD